MEPSVAEQQLQLFFILGAPGVGKGTVCAAFAKLRTERKFYHLSVGDYLRELHQLGHHWVGNVDFKDSLQKRLLLPPQVIVELLEEKIALIHESGYCSILVDGFPRELAAAAAFEEKIGKPVAVIFLHCPEPVAKARFLSRQRGDDDEHYFDKRWKEFHIKNEAVMQRYESLIHEINTSASTGDVLNALKDIMAAYEMTEAGAASDAGSGL